ncbi:MAG: Uncharacterised protein [Cyanobium sp. ARS6]|nr:MAG: Uncharacterised protein [Cyanobium sp. ARS6]
MPELVSFDPGHSDPAQPRGKDPESEPSLTAVTASGGGQAGIDRKSQFR